MPTRQQDSWFGRAEGRPKGDMHMVVESRKRPTARRNSAACSLAGPRSC